MNLIFFLSIPIVIIFVNYIFNKKNVLQSLTGDNHQLFVEKKNIPLTGGIFLTILSIIIFYSQIEYFYFFIIFLIGILSDLKVLQSAKIRFYLQVISIFFLVFNFNLHLSDLRIIPLNYLLEYKIFSYIFFSFCLLIVVNGTNFIDGLNGLVIGYYMIVLMFIFNLEFIDKYDDAKEIILIYLILLIFLFIFNFLNKLYLGDSGSYLIGFAIGALLITIYKEFSIFSPFYVVLLLWYPCFENLFSIIRKYRFNLSPLKADNKHLHHLLFYYLNKRFNFSKLSSNNIASLLINFVNLNFFVLGSNYIYSSIIQIILITSLIAIYIISYLILFNFRFKKSNY